MVLSNELYDNDFPLTKIFVHFPKYKFFKENRMFC